MKTTFLSGIALAIGLMLLVAGIYYRRKEKDRESQKIYTIASAIGTLIAIAAAVVWIMA